MARLLLVDDDRFVLKAVHKLLAMEGYYCQTAVNAEEARRALDAEEFDLMILDVGLPDIDGFTFCRQIRMKHKIPVLFLSARDENADKVIGLEVGGDDYMTKPFAPRELVARVRAHLRRMTEYSVPAENNNQITVGDLVVDLDQHDAFRNNQPAHLTDREFELLHLLARNRERALATDWIFENVWGYDADLGVKTLAVYVRRLRRKIEENPDAPRYLVTIRGFGYKLTAGDPP